MTDISKIGVPQHDAKAAVEQIQLIDPQSIVRAADLGPFALSQAVEPLKDLVRLFAQIPIQYISELPDQQATQLRDQAQSILNRIRDLDEFDPTSEDSPKAKQEQLVDGLRSAYPTTFNAIWHHIGYLASRERDFAAMEVEARSAIESVKSESKKLGDSLRSQNKDAEKILKDIKQVAAETGVSQQAIHFSTESTAHSTQAKKWHDRTLIALGVLIAYGVLTIFLHRIPFISPENAYDTVQLAVSKVVIFIVLFYALTLSAKNYLAHKHSEVVNKHRQNALATYKAIADAAHDEAGRDIVLSHAADCIFSPQDTDYLAGKRREGTDAAPTLQVLPRVASSSDA